MLQAVMTKPGIIEYKEVEKPQVKDDQVLVKIKRIGICGSDIHVFLGKHPYTDYPIVQGHELSGIIEEAGKNAGDLSEGDRVTVMPQLTCGQCYPCRNGMYHICNDLKVLGFQSDGVAQDYFAIDKEMVLKIPESLSLDEGAMIEPAAVAVHAVKRSGDVAGKNILVMGAGPIGNLACQAAKGLGASRTMIVDLSDFRLDLAARCGIDHPVNNKKEDIGKAVLDDFGKDKLDLIFECVGSQQTISQAIELARKGSNIIIVGVFGEKPVVDLGLVQDRELSLIGTLMYQEDDFLEAIDLAEKGKIKLERMVTDRFGFKDFIKAYRYILDKKDSVLKVMIDFDR